MTYTTSQIENAKANYNAMLVMRSVDSYEPEIIGYAAANQRCDYHNQIVSQILAGDLALAKKWKLFFLDEQVKSDRKAAESKAKIEANKAASADVLAPIKEAKKLVAFGKWLNTTGNPFRSQHFSKKYTKASVDAFMSI